MPSSRVSRNARANWRGARALLRPCAVPRHGGLSAHRSVQGRGIAVLLIEQNARKALEVADYGCVLSGGTVVLEGPTASLRANDAVVHAYLRAQPAPPSKVDINTGHGKH